MTNCVTCVTENSFRVKQERQTGRTLKTEIKLTDLGMTIITMLSNKLTQSHSLRSIRSPRIKQIEENQDVRKSVMSHYKSGSQFSLQFDDDLSQVVARINQLLQIKGVEEHRKLSMWKCIFCFSICKDYCSHFCIVSDCM